MTSHSTCFSAAGMTLTPLASALLVLGLGTAGLARAQSGASPAATAAEAGSAQQLDTVVITASKRSEKQREVAGSVTVLQGGVLEARGTKDQEDLFKLTPGVQFNKLGGDNSVITIRGIGTSAQGNFVQGTTGIYIEDVPFNDPYVFRTAPDVKPFDLERVEVLRGPQGVLFGSSSMGGAVRYLFNKPNLKQNEAALLGEVSGTKGGGTNHAENAMANMVLGERAALRAVVFNRDESGWVNNSKMGREDTNKLRQHGGRFLATFAPTKDLNVTALYMTQSTRVDDSSNVEDIATLSKTGVSSLSPRDSKFDLASVQVNYDLPSVRLTSITGYLKKTIAERGDANRYAAFYGPDAFLLIDEKSRATSQEFRVTSNTGGPFSWLAGAFYQSYRYDQNDSIEMPAFGSTFPSLLASRASESAVFAQGDYAFATGVTVGVGARYYRTKNDIDSFVGSSTNNSTSSDKGVTPKVSIKYKIDEGTLVYGLVSRGYRFGGINITQFSPNLVDPTYVTPPTYESDSLVNYEVGLRLTPAPTIRLDATLFLIDWKDLQLNVPRPGDSFPYVDNIGSARSEGLELATTWTPVPALTLTSAWAYTRARITDPYNSPTGLVPSGTGLPGTPRWQFANQANFRFDGPMDSEGRLNLTHTYTGASYNDLFKTTGQGGFHLLDARVALTFDRWELSLFGNNLANKRGVAGAAAFAPFFTDYYVNKPRTIGMSLRYDL